MASNALRNLDNRLRDVDQLLEAHRELGGGARGRRWNVAALNRSAIVLLVAHLEGFIEDLFSEALGSVLAWRLNAANIPPEIKLLCLRPAASSFRDAARPERKEEALRRLLELAIRLGHPRKRVGPADINAANILAAFSSPTPHAIDRIMGHLGISRIIDRVRWRGMSPARRRGRIQSLVDRRNQIAHGTIGVRVGRAEVEFYRGFIPRLAALMDWIVRAHLVGFSGQEPWPA